MNYFIILVLLPVITHAMDLDLIQKNSNAKVQALLNGKKLSEQDRKSIFTHWATLSLIPFLHYKQQNNQELMKCSLNSIAPELDLFFNKGFIKNSVTVCDDKNQYSINLAEEAQKCGAMSCLHICLKHNPDSLDQKPMELIQQLFDIKRNAIASNLQGVMVKSPDYHAMTEILFLASQKEVERTTHDHCTGYDSIG